MPDPLPEGRPGDLIASEQVAVDGLDGTLWRVMYLSESMAGEPIAVTGMIAVPDGAAPEGGWPVVTWAHGTTGIADTCAPSLDPAALDPLANKLLAQGYVVTATDYEGMGTPGRHPYIAGESEGRGVLDIVKTARRCPRSTPATATRSGATPRAGTPRSTPATSPPSGPPTSSSSAWSPALPRRSCC